MRLNTYAVHFASIGGACYGLHCAGLRCVAAFEHQQDRLDFRERNLGHKGLCVDLSKYEPEAEHAADVLWTSPPCTMLSSASREYVDLDDPINLLYLASVKYCRVLKPKYVILENVPGILTHKSDGSGNNTLTKWRRDFEEIGYRTEYNILNSKYFGVPQDRERVFMVGSIEGKTGLIPKENLTIDKKFGAIQEHSSVVGCWEAKTYRTVMDAIARNSARNGSPYGFRLIGHNDILPCVTCSFDGGATRKKVGILDSKDGITYVRQPTPREGARAQGFPDSWELPASRTIAWHYVGDAVTSPVAQAIAEHLEKIESGQRPPFKQRLSAKRVAKCLQELENTIPEECFDESLKIPIENCKSNDVRLFEEI